LVAAVLATSPGCSLLVVDGPPPADVRPRVDLVGTTSPVLPILNLLASAFVLAHEFGELEPLTATGAACG
jgi:hypothetical protein